MCEHSSILIQFVAQLGYIYKSKELGEGAAETSQPQHSDRSGWKQGRHRKQESHRPSGMTKYSTMSSHIQSLSLNLFNCKIVINFPVL